MAYEWQNSGPGKLDLLTPLKQGVEAGAMAAYRQDQVKAQAQQEERMREQLGLQQQTLDFQKSVFTAGEGLRRAQLSEAQSKAQMLTTVADQTTQGAPLLAEAIHQLANATPEDLDSISVPEGLSSEQQQQFTQALVAKKTTLAYQTHQNTISSQNLTGAQITSAFQKAGGQVEMFDGMAMPTDPQFVTNGKPNYAAMSKFVSEAENVQADVAEQRKTNSAITINNAKQESIADRQIEVNKEKARDLSGWATGDATAYKSATSRANAALSSMSKLFPGDPNYDFFKQQYSQSIDEMKQIRSSYPGAEAQAPSGTPTMNNSEALTTPEQVNALPSGAVYTWADGKKYRKK